MARAVALDIARTLKTRIEAGEWAQTRIPPERDLATEFGVARNTVRRAMAVLKDEGSIAGHVGRGTFVRSQARSLADIVARMRGSSPADVMEIRIMIEPDAAAFAATNASASEIGSCEEAHRQAVGAVEMPLFEQWDAEFHHRIVMCSRNDLLRNLHDLLRVLRNQTPWFEMKRRSFSEPRRQLYCTEHQAVLDALHVRDPETARGAMLTHLLTVRRNMLGR